MITDYSTLKTEIANWIHRSDLTTNIPTFIQLTESKIANSIKGLPLETTITQTLTAGVNTLTLPNDYNEMQNIVVQSNPTSILEFVPDNVLSQYNSTNTSGVPEFFTIVGNNILLSKIPDSNYSITITYIAKLTSLSDINTSNWVLTNFPYLYLYGSLIEASIYTNDPDQVQFYQTKFDSAIIDVISKYSNQKFSGSPLYAKSDYVI
jgi:hypothetical protein